MSHGPQTSNRLWTANPKLWCRLADQAFALAHYLATQRVTGTDEDDRDPVDRACDHVTSLAGYSGDEACWVSFDLAVSVRRRLRDLGYGERVGRRVDEAPEWAS